MSDNLKVGLEIRTSTPGAEQVQGLENSVRELGQAAAGSATGQARAAEAATRLGQSAGQARQETVELKSELEKLGNQLNAVRNIALAAFTGSFVGQQIKDVAATADAYANLSARIKIVTGDGQALKAAMQGVQDVALATSANLENTADLFTRIARAGKDMGVSQQAALALTQTINQAIQLSGGSAESANAAITQLIQGLQSGVLRGDEFNSVMEQSPRLAQALADGLGVTIGQLRKMANEGQLTSQTVISALQLQTQTIQGEFDKLPPTVGRSLQNLSTAWTVLVGETDKATGASQMAARAIQALADNLPVVAQALYTVGKAGAAFAALRLAQAFLGIGQAAKTAAVEVSASAAAMNAANTAAAGAAVSAGRFAAILGSLKAFTFVGLLTSLPEIGKWLGETTAKLMGYRDRTQEIEAAERVRNQTLREQAALEAQLAAKRQAAINEQFDLSKAAQGAIAQFDQLRQNGTLAAEAVAQIGKSFDTNSMQGIRDYSAVLNKLAYDGKIGADEVNKAWSAALKNADLGVFATTATAALQGVTGGAERLKTVLDQVSQEALRRVGSSAQEVKTGFSEAFSKAASDTDVLAKNLKAMGADAETSGRLLSAAFKKELDAANTNKAVQSVIERMTELGKQGLITGQQLSSGLEAAKKKADELTPGINSLREAYEKLGVKSDEALKKEAQSNLEAARYIEQHGGSVREITEAYKKYLEAALAANGGVVDETMQVQAAMHGLEIAVDNTGKAFVRTKEEAERAGQAGANAGRQSAGAMQTAADATEQYIAALERAQQQAERLAEIERKRKGIDKEGFSVDKSGNRIVAGGDLTTRTGIFNFLKAAGVDDVNARRITDEFTDPQGNVPFMNNGGQAKYGGPYSTISQALLKAAEQVTFRQGGGVGIDKPGQGGTAPTRTVNVNISLPTGQRFAVATNSDADAQRLIEALKTAGLTSAPA